MKYLGYLLILACFLAGYFSIHIIVVAASALLSTLIFASERRKALKSQVHAPDQNMVLDGAFLLFLQSIIMFTLYILGWFIANKTDFG